MCNKRIMATKVNLDLKILTQLLHAMQHQAKNSWCAGAPGRDQPSEQLAPTGRYVCACRQRHVREPKRGEGRPHPI